jgi:cell wall assembly regulator SMI1
MSEIDRAVQELERWFEKFDRPPARVFGPPASERELRELEESLGRALPSDYRELMLRLGGQRFVPIDERSGHVAQLIHGLDLLPLALARGEWRSMVEDWDDLGPGDIEADGPVKPLYKHELWFPITCIFGSSQYHCLDLDPAPGGAIGQVIWMADDDERRRVVAPSFTAFFARITALLADHSPADEGIELSDEAFDRLLFPA